MCQVSALHKRCSIRKLGIHFEQVLVIVSTTVHVRKKPPPHAARPGYSSPGSDGWNKEIRYHRQLAVANFTKPTLDLDKIRLFFTFGFAPAGSSDASMPVHTSLPQPHNRQPDREALSLCFSFSIHVCSSHLQSARIDTGSPPQGDCWLG